jgi:hypothetical protein
VFFQLQFEAIMNLGENSARHRSSEKLFHLGSSAKRSGLLHVNKCYFVQRIMTGFMKG